MDAWTIIQALIGLLFVVALIVLVFQLLRGSLKQWDKRMTSTAITGTPQPLTIVQRLNVDFKRQLVEVKWHNQQILLLLSPQQDVVVSVKPSVASPPPSPQKKMKRT